MAEQSGIGKLRDFLTGLNKPFTSFAKKVEKPTKRLAEVGSQKAMDVYDDAGELVFGEDTGLPAAVDVGTGFVPFGGLGAHAATGTRPGLVDFLDFIPEVGTGAHGALAALKHSPELMAGFFALTKAERKDLMEVLGKKLGLAADKNKERIKDFESMPEGAKNSILAAYADLNFPESMGGAQIRPHSDIGNGATSDNAFFSPASKKVNIGKNLVPWFDIWLHESGHSMDDQLNYLLQPIGGTSAGKLIVPKGESGLVKNWYERIPVDEKLSMIDPVDNQLYLDPTKLKDLIWKSKNFSHYFDRSSILNYANSPLGKNEKPLTEFDSAIATLNQGILNGRLGGKVNLKNPPEYRYILGDKFHTINGINDYYGKRAEPETLMATEGVAKAMQLMPLSGFQNSSVGKRLAEILEQNPVQYFKLDYDPFVKSK